MIFRLRQLQIFLQTKVYSTRISGLPEYGGEVVFMGGVFALYSLTGGWDSKHFVVCGSSQGGGLAFVTAGLCREVTAFNQLTGEKEMVNMPATGHGSTRAFRNQQRVFIRMELGFD